MNKAKKNNFPITNIGSVTLMMIFIVLCMVSFAALSLSTAVSDYQAAQKSVNHTKDYYQASNKAEETLASIDTTLTDAYKTSTDASSYLEQVRAAYASDSSFTLSEDNDGITLSYKTDINEKQALDTSLLIQYPSAGTSATAAADDALYKITSWQVVSTSEWNGDNSVKLIDK